MAGPFTRVVASVDKIRAAHLNAIYAALENLGIADVAGLQTALNGKLASNDASVTNARPPTGAAGGVLAGNYPSPTFAADMATQAELDAHAAIAATTSAAGHMTTAQVTKLNALGLVYRYTNLTVPAAIANSTTATAFGVTHNVPANTLIQGTQTKVIAKGLISTAATAPNITIELLYGSTVIGTTGVVTTGASLANRLWVMEFDIATNAAPAASVATEAQGHVVLHTSTVAAAHIDMENTATINLATNAANAFSVRVTWGTANASNTIMMRQFLVTIIQ